MEELRAHKRHNESSLSPAFFLEIKALGMVETGGQRDLVSLLLSCGKKRSQEVG